MPLATSAVVLVSVAGAASSPRWGGLTEREAVEKAKKDVVALALAFGAKPGQLAKARRFLDSHKPRTTRVRCTGQYKGQAWRVDWPQETDPIYVRRGALMVQIEIGGKPAWRCIPA